MRSTAIRSSRAIVYHYILGPYKTCCLLRNTAKSVRPPSKLLENEKGTKYQEPYYHLLTMVDLDNFPSTFSDYYLSSDILVFIIKKPRSHRGTASTFTQICSYHNEIHRLVQNCSWIIYKSNARHPNLYVIKLFIEQFYLHIKKKRKLKYPRNVEQKLSKSNITELNIV